MSTKISKKRFIEILKKLIRREIDEASTSVNVPGYMTPHAFSGKGKMDRRDSVASGSGYEKIDEVKFAVTVDMGQLGQGKVLVDAGSKGQAKTQVAKKLKQGLKGIISVSRVQPSLGKQVDKKIETITVDEAVDPKVKKQAASLLKRYTNNWKKLEKETEMLMKFAKKSKANEMAMNFEEVLKKLKGSVWDNIRYQVEKPMDDFFYESVNIDEGKGVEKIMKMANDQSFGKLAGRTVDGMTAQLFKQVYDKAPQNAKDKIDKMNEKQLYVFMGKLWSKFGRQVSIR